MNTAPLPFPCPAPSVEAIDEGRRFTRRCRLDEGHTGSHAWSRWQPTTDETIATKDEGEAAEAC